VAVPAVREGNSSVCAHYTIRVPDRDGLRARLADEGVPTAAHYPRPLHHQPAYRRFPTATARLPLDGRLAAEVVSLPMHGHLAPEVQQRVTTGDARSACEHAPWRRVTLRPPG
jgi:UDP-2-acetamido-2-deoxy-ribo-hexuluronate aminotransferase